MTVTATATASDTARTVTVSVGDTGTATSGTDYAAVSDFDITIAANATTGTGTFTLTPTQDTTYEGSETIGLAGSATGSSVTGTSVTLTDDDSAPGVTLSASPSTVGEQSPATSVTVTATATSSVAFARTITVSVGGTGTATSGTDYDAVTDFTITINANAKTGTGTFTLTPTQDAALEGDETIGVSGTSPNTTVTGTTLTLTDDDRPTITLATVPANVKVAENVAQSSVTVRATAAAPVNAETKVTLTVGATGDSATKTTDYTVSNVGTITIPKGQATAQAWFDVAPVQDTLVEGDETVSISGSSDKGNTVTGTSFVLTDNDVYPDLTLSAAPSSVGEGASATTVTVTATAASAVASARTVTVSVGGTGTATSGTDYAAVADFTITLAANAKTGTGTFTLTPTDDTTVEGSETIDLAGTSTRSTVKGTSVTLTDDDSYPALTLSANPSSVSEGASATTVTVTATATTAVSSPRRVTVSVGGSGTASAGVDYATVADFGLVIAANAKSGTATFSLKPKQDTLVEGSETIGVAGRSPSSTVTGTTVTLADDDTHAIDLTASPSTVAEDKTSETVTVTATINVARSTATTVTVSVGDSADTAQSGRDYTAVPDFTITIAANATKGTGTFEFKPLNDSAYEGFESVTISGATSGTATPTPVAATAKSPVAATANTSPGIPVNDTSLTIHDASDYPPVTLTATPSSVGEGASATQVTVTATASSAIAASREVTVSVGGSGTATSGTDYAAVKDFIIKIAANATSATGTFTLTPAQDTLVEGNETVGVSGTSLSTTVTGTTVSITDDDAAPSVSLSPSPTSLAEGASGTLVTVTAAFSNTNTYADDQTVTVSVGDTGTATSGTDYTDVTDFDLTITAGDTSGTATFTLTPTQDTVVEGDETIGVSGSATGLTVNGADITLTDDDAKPQIELSVQLSLNKNGIGEGDGATTVTVKAAFSNTNTFAADQTVTVSVGGSGSATSGTDYAAVSNFDVTIATGSTSGTATFTLTPTQDTLIEGNETIGVAGTATGLTVNGTELTLTDDDTTPAVNLSLNPLSVGEGAGATQVTVTAAFSNTSTYGDDKTVTVSVGGSGTATSGTDYAAVSSFDITITKGTTSGTGTFTLTPTQDTLVEGNETIGVAGTATGLTVNGTTMTLTDDDGAPAVNLSLNPSSVGEGASATTVTVTAAFSNSNTYAADKTVTVSVGGSGTATSGTDYAAVTDFDVTVSKGTTSGTATFTLTPTQDTLIEGNETIGVAGTATGLTVNGTTMTLTDDDGAPAVNLSLNPSSVGEGASATTVTVTAAFSNSNTYAADKTVTVSVGGSGTATSGTDYAAVADFDMTITKGTTSGTATFTLTSTQDTLIEGNETIGVAGTATGLTVNGADLTLTDDDTAPTVNLSLSPSSVGEGASATTVTVTAAFSNSSTYAADKTVTVSVGGSGTAISGTDYAAVTGFDVTISAGQTSGTATFTLTPTQDTLIEGNETVGIAGTATGLTVNGTTMTLTDDDGTPAINLSASPASLSEGVGATAVTVSAEFSNGRTYGVDKTVTVKVGASGDGAVPGADYAAVADFDVTIAAGASRGDATFTLTPLDDTLIESDETTRVGGVSADLAVNGTRVTLVDNDGTPLVNLSVDPARVSESAGATAVTVTAAFSNGSTYGGDTRVTVSVGAAGDGAAAGTDYAAVADFSIVIPAGSGSGAGTFTLTPVNDALVEDDETITVAGAATGLTVNGTRMTLADASAASAEVAPEIDLSVDPGSVSEGDGATPVTVTARFSDGDTYGVDTEVTVSVGGSGGATAGFGAGVATEGADYAAVADFSIVIPAGAGSGAGTFTLTPVQDTLIEGDETITIGGTSPGLTVNGTRATLTDEAPPEIDLSVEPPGVSEGAGAATVTVTAAFSNASTYGADTAVTVSVGAGGDGGTSGGSAFPGVDYAAVADFTITIPAGAGSGRGTFTLTPVDDTLIEGDETIGVAGASPGLTVNGAGVTLIDDDSAPEIELSVDPSSVAEGGGATAVTVTAAFTNASTYGADTAVTVSVGGGGDTAEAGVDYAAVADFDVTIAAGSGSGAATFTLTPADDDIVEGDETISLSGRMGDLADLAASAALTLQDDDDARVTVADASAAEGSEAVFEVSLSAPVASDVELAWSTADGTARAADGDYGARRAVALTLPAGTQSAEIAVATLTDIEVEGDETFEVRLKAAEELPVGVSLAQAPGSGTIVDDDEAVSQRLMKVHEPILADLSLSMTGSVMDAVSGRFRGRAGSSFGFAGTPTGGAADPTAAGLMPGGGHGQAGSGFHPNGGQARYGAGFHPNGGHGQIGSGFQSGGGLGHHGSAFQQGGGHYGQYGAGPRQGGAYGQYGDREQTLFHQLSRMSFIYSLDGDGDGAENVPLESAPGDLTLWGRGDYRSLGGGHEYGPGDSVRWDGEVLGLITGADMALGPGSLAGLAVSRFGSAFDYAAEEPGAASQGVYGTEMAALHPYANFTPRPGLEVWMMGGYGLGEVEFDEEGFGTQAADARWLTGAAGGRMRIGSSETLIRGGATTLDAKAEVWATRFGVEANGGLIESLDVDAQRFRLAVAGGHTRLVESGGRFVWSPELAARRDGGDGEVGTGLEVASGLQYEGPDGRFSVGGRVHALAAFSGDKREWGVAASVSLKPGQDGLGLSFDLRPSYGAAGGGGGLWDAAGPMQPGPAGFGGDGSARVDADFGYGLPAWRGRGVLTLLGGYGWRERTQPRQTVGALLDRGALNLRLDIERAEGRGDGPGYGFMLKGQVLFGGDRASHGPISDL